ncbi:MAG: UDP-N-acetylglucosamine--N-acetylmuramyl-(pentapeptide) pyrophosphoryl-undecaprenol N-acetylglucosamine transferase [Chlamydiae bacterium]|nr:UDP-N-acetylglucosamine--N-acetylmuramyl-(pentapeptide) pyrophosphoryl-undecaprenol N-acetylglucosamine transferase [Chlamydiota bacterium]
MAKKILIAAGGTGGHLFPAQALATQLLSEGFEVLFVGSDLSKNTFFNAPKFSYVEIKASSLKKGKGLIKGGFKIFRGALQSYRLIKRYKPDFLISFGSYHTLPTLLANMFLKVPLYLHEQNVQIGKVNRLFVKRARALLSHYSSTKPYFPQKNKRVEMPLRFYKKNSIAKEDARKILHLHPLMLTVLIFGGSQGAQSINKAFLASLDEIKQRNFQVIHLAGKDADILEIQKRYESFNVTSFVKPFYSEMSIILKAADCAVSRAGASTIAELIEFEVPALLIPYPYASNHQEHNADYMQQVVGGGIKLLEKDINDNLLGRFVQNLLTENIREEYMKSMKMYKKQTADPSFLKFIKREINVDERT